MQFDNILLLLHLDKEAKFEALEKEFNEYKEKYSVSNEEFEELKTYKLNKEAEERKFAEDTIFADYEETIGFAGMGSEKDLSGLFN